MGVRKSNAFIFDGIKIIYDDISCKKELRTQILIMIYYLQLKYIKKIRNIVYTYIAQW